MAKQLADVEIHAEDSQGAFADYNLDVSVDLIDEGLYLGNLACAHDHKTLEKLQITHILTIDLVPLPRTILDRPNLTFKYMKLADVPKEDLISHLPQSNEFIRQAVSDGGTVLVHCYFGVSRSAAVVIAYVMEKYGLCYDDAFALVRAKRRFVSPNVGFAAQLKLFGHMGCSIDRDDPRFKQFRLKMAGQKLKQVKILPQLFADLVKPDPGLVRERPDPSVYRCKKCRRVVAAQRNIIPHIPKQLKIELAKKGIRPPPSKLTGLHCAENGQLLIEKLKSLACQIIDTSSRSEESSDESPGRSQKSDSNTEGSEDGPSQNRNSPAGLVVHHCPLFVIDTSSRSEEYSDESIGRSQRNVSNTEGSEDGPSQALDGYSELNMVDANIAARADAPEICRAMWFVEPMTWMQRVTHDTHGKLHCPKCANKLGSFNWVMGCKCPCGQKVAPAFYLVPSKVEWSNIVQNVQITV